MLTNAAQQIAVDRAVAALIGQPFAGVALDLDARDPPRENLRAFDAVRHQRHRVGRRSAAHEKSLRPLFAEPDAQGLHRFDQPAAPVAGGIGHQIGQYLTAQLQLVALLQRHEAGHQPRFGRKGGEQRLAETVDRLDAQAAAGRVQHLREQAARARLVFGAEGSADGLEVGRQKVGFHPHPGGEPGVDAVGHLRRAGLGKGEAQQVLGRAAAEQQPEHARGQHLRLARARRGAEPDVAVRRHGGALVVTQGVENGVGHGKSSPSMGGWQRAALTEEALELRQGSMRRTPSTICLRQTVPLLVPGRILVVALTPRPARTIRRAASGDRNRHRANIPGAASR